MSGAYELRAATGEDTDEIVALMARALGAAMPRTQAFWRWKHECNPFGRSACIVATAAGSIVGVRAFLRWCWTSSAGRLPAVRAVDTATAPEWQGKGVFSRLTRTLLAQLDEEGVAFVFNTPNDKSRPGYIKMGWRLIGPVPLLAKPLRPLAVLRLLRNGTADTPPSRVGEHASPSVSSFLDSGCLESMNRESDARLSTLRTTAYLAWRYRDVPGIQYAARWRLERDGRVAVIYRVKEWRGVRELRLAELFTDGTKRACNMALDLIGEVAESENADIATAVAAPSTPERAILRSAWFIPAKRWGPLLTVRRLTAAPTSPELNRPYAWRLSAGDVELF